MTGFNLRSYLIKETAIGIVVNVLVSTVPSFMVADFTANTSVSSVREVAVGLTPQFFMAALMTALIPSLLTCWRHAKGTLGLSVQGRRLRPDRAVLIAIGLSVASTALVLGLIHLIVAPMASGGLGAIAILVLQGSQAAFAAATVTPAALFLLLGRYHRPSIIVSRTKSPSSGRFQACGSQCLLG